MNDEIEMMSQDKVEEDALVELDDTADTVEAIVPSSDAPETDTTERPKITFMGNTYDMTSLFAFATGILVLITCLTCGQIIYCLPVFPIILGIIGLVMAKQSLDADRTRLWSWLGIGSGGIAFVIYAVAIVAYLIFVGLVVWMSSSGYLPSSSY